LSLTQPVGLRYSGYQISVKEVKRNPDGSIAELVALCTKTSDSVKPKGFIQWVSHPLKCEVRLIEKLLIIFLFSFYILHHLLNPIILFADLTMKIQKIQKKYQAVG